MRALIINCSPVRTGATAEIVKLVSEQLSNKYSVKSICIDDYVFDVTYSIPQTVYQKIYVSKLSRSKRISGLSISHI